MRLSGLQLFFCVGGLIPGCPGVAAVGAVPAAFEDCVEPPGLEFEPLYVVVPVLFAPSRLLSPAHAAKNEASASIIETVMTLRIRQSLPWLKFMLVAPPLFELMKALAAEKMKRQLGVL